MDPEVYDKNYLDFYDPEKCNGDLGEKWCTFKWHIQNLHLNPGNLSQSPAFTTRLLLNTYWYLDLMVSLADDYRVFQVSLRRLEKDEEIKQIVDVIYKIVLLEEEKTSDKITLVYKKETKEIMNERYDYGVSFKKSKKGPVTVECKLRPNKCMVKGVCHDRFDEALPVHLRKLLQSGELCDTIIRIHDLVNGDQDLMAHYAILSARLPKLIPEEMPMEKGKRVIKINDLPVSTVKEMLKYAYTGQACLDLESISFDKAILDKYSNKFSQRCCWEDNPIASTSFDFETYSLEWKLEDIDRSNKGRNKIESLKIYPNKLDLSLRISKRGLTLKFKYNGKEMPKSIVSCKYSILDILNNEIFEFKQTETLLHSNVTEAKMKLCSLVKLMSGMSTLRKGENKVLKTEFKFCDGSSKSSIGKLYQGHFDILRCKSCALLSADLEQLYRSDINKDILVTSGRNEISAHKAILVSRWNEAENYEVKENSSIELEGYSYESLNEFLRRFYTGTST